MHFGASSVKEMQLTIDKETSTVIDGKCFEFVQQLVMKNPRVLKLTTMFDSMYSEWSSQGIQCCIFPRDNLNNSTQCQSQWSALVKCIRGVIKENRKKKSKLSSCMCDNSRTEMNDFVLSCQPLKYDHISSTLHSVITWYIDSTSFASEDKDENEVINDGEWGVVNKKFHKWPLYQLQKIDNDKGGDMVVDFVHKFFDGDINNRCTPLIIQLQQDTSEQYPNHDKEVPNFLMMIHIPLNNTSNSVEAHDYDGFHTFEDQGEMITLSNVKLYCCRGMNKNCSCLQLPTQSLTLKKIKIDNHNYSIRGFFLHNWPYDHDPRKQDQLAPVIESLEMKNRQHQREPPPSQYYSPCCWCTCINDKYVNQECFCQKLMLVNSNHHHVQQLTQ